ncbi:MAG: phosphatase PAP2 family protein [Candidatus Woesearchaeota archaeon]|nr:phosphatase PAP2 family protein [Candidatus Woesearchaeota archaeon]MDP7506191.1 phosphatase PAP2 family protein [Candidatus Woesearchaeota archaeon]
MQKRMFYLIGVEIVVAFIFYKLVNGIINNNVRLDIFLNEKVMVLWNPLLNRIMILVTMIMDTKVAAGLAIGLLVVLLSRKRFYDSFLLVSSLIIGQAVKSLMKLIMIRIRPSNALIHAEGFSFPSGHATIAIIFFSLLIYFFRNDIKNKFLKNLFIAVNILMILLIGFSRVYLGVHWASDVMGGFCLGLGVVLFGMLSKIYKEKKFTFF